MELEDEGETRNWSELRKKLNEIRVGDFGLLYWCEWKLGFYPEHYVPPGGENVPPGDRRDGSTNFCCSIGGVYFWVLWGG